MRHIKFLPSLVFLFIVFLFSTHSALAANFTVSGKVSDGQGHYVGFANVAILDPNTGAKLTDVVSNTNTGNYSLSVAEGTYSIRIVPSTGWAYQQKTLTHVVITGDTQLDITLDPTPGSVAFTGRILTPDSQPIGNTSTSLSSSQGGVNFVTDSSGTYFLRVFPRTDYTFLISRSVASSDPPLDIPGYFRITNSPFSLTQDLTQDIVIPTAHVSVHIQDPNGNSAPNVLVTTTTDLPANFYQNGIGQMQGISESATSGNSDANGNVILKVLPSGPNPGNYIITAYPQSGPYFDNRLIANYELVDRLSFTIPLSTIPTVYGRIINGNTPLSNQTVELIQNNSVINSITTDDQGNYYTKVPIGNYTFTAHSNGKIPFGPTSYAISGGLNLSTSKQVSIGLGGYTIGNVNVKVRDAASTTTPVAAHVVANGTQVPLTIYGLTNATGVATDEAYTDSAGNARLYLFNTGSSTNGYTITATPSNTNYLPNSITNFLLDGGVETTIYVTANHPPTANAGGPYTVNEGSSITLNGSGSDLENDPLIYSWDLDNNGAFETSGQNVTLPTNLDGPSSKTVILQVCDNHAACTTSQATVSILNLSPMVGIITAPTSPVQVNTAISVNANFTDPGVLDTHIAVWGWGDGTITAGTVSETNGSGSVSNTHTYTSAGVYTVKLTVTDKDGGAGSNQFQYVVVYDSSAGFLTGGGQYSSQVGWDTQNTQATGKVQIGISAKYTSGNTTPTGQTKINFQAGNIDFVSTSYQWLVVSGSRATLEGSGTINGSGNYTFLLSGIDGSQTGGQNLIRIKIIDSSNNVIYDTQNGAADTADPTTPLSNGVIKVH